MGRRKRRKKIIPRLKKKIPKIFICPNCGQKAVKVTINKSKNTVLVKCGYCNISAKYEYNPTLQEVDYYSKFVDDYNEGKIIPKSK